VAALAADRHLFVEVVAVLANGAAVGRTFNVARDGALTFFVFAWLRVAIHARTIPSVRVKMLQAS
jgi:hypothetical protein